MAAFAAPFSSSSHALLGLGFKKRKQNQQQPRNWACRRLSVVRNSSSSLPGNDDPAVLRNGFNGIAADIPLTELQRNEEEQQGGGERSQLLRKLSDANQYIRTLQQELRQKEDALQNTRRDLSAVENELQVLANVAQEISRQGIKPGTRKINGRYIHSHLVSRLREMQKTLEERVRSFDHVQARSIDLVYHGMAEDVQVMGSFDGWTRGDQMSPESTGTFTKFTTTIKLRPGRYEIKFLVDGEWHLSPDLPTVGQGLTINNLLVVD